jgi:hypothetical protein
MRVPSEPDSKAYVTNHQQPRTAFESDNGRSVLQPGTTLHAPKPTPMITLANGEVGWKGGIPDLPGL